MRDLKDNAVFFGNQVSFCTSNLSVSILVVFILNVTYMIYLSLDFVQRKPLSPE